VGSRRSKPQRTVRAQECEWFRLRDQFGVVLVLLIVTVFFSISAPNESWAWLATTATLAATLTLAMVTSGAQKRVVGAGIALAATGLGMSTVIALTQEDAWRYLSVTSLLLTLLATGAIIRRVRLHAEINMLTVLAAVCIYVLLGLSFAFVFECIGKSGPGPSLPRTRRGRAATTRISASSRWPPWATEISQPRGPRPGRRRNRGTTGPDLPCHHRRGPGGQPRTHAYAHGRDGTGARRERAGMITKPGEGSPLLFVGSRMSRWTGRIRAG